MAPISPDSLKRSSASQSSDDEIEEPMRKRVRLDSGEKSDKVEHVEHQQVDNLQTELTLPRTPPPEASEVVLEVNKNPLFNDDPQRLLERSVALVLQHVGFEAADSDALNALCSEVDACEYFSLRGILPD